MDDLQTVGIKLSEIINQDYNEKTDGQCIDDIVKYLMTQGLYYERT